MINSRYEKVFLKDLTTIMHQGINTAADKVVYSSTGMPIIQSRNFTSGKLDIDKTKFLGGIDVKKYGEKYIAKKGDVLFSNIGTVGKSVVVNDCPDFMFAWNVFLIRPKHDLISNRYLQYYLSYLSDLGAYEPYFTGGTVKFLNKKTISSFKIPLPPLEEQQKIAAILDAAEALRQKDQQLIDHYTALSQSLFLDMFGDPVRNPKNWSYSSLAEHGEFKNGLNFKKGESGLTVKYLGVGDFKLHSRIDDINSLGFINLNNSPSDNYLLKDGDIVFVRSNGNRKLVGRSVAVYPKKEKVTFSGFCIRYRIEDNLLNAIYLTHLFREKSFREVLLQSGQGANIQNINQKLLSALEIPLPAIAIQNQFAEHIEIIEQQKQQAQASLEQSNNLFNSLLQKAFTGELTQSKAQVA